MEPAKKHKRSCNSIIIILFMLSVSCAIPSCSNKNEKTSGTKPVFNSENIFPFQDDHVHGSTIVELPNGDLLAGWFQGSGERQADDVRVMGARKKDGEREWSQPFILADVKEFPDCNPVLFLDGKNRLWLMWYTVIAHQWETSLLKYRISEDYSDMSGAPKWNWQADLHIKPGDQAEYGIQPDDSFVQSVQRQLEEYAKYLKSFSDENFNAERWNRHVENTISKARGENMIRSGRIYNENGEFEGTPLGYPYFRRMGWQTRNKPFITTSGRMIVPLYSDGFSFSLMAFTDDWGESWDFSEPLVGGGNIQPAIAKTGSGELVAYMRDNGPAPKRLHVSRSGDNGETWSPVRDSEIPNPGSGADIVTLENGHWVLVFNDTERGRHILAVALSEDEGKTWPWHKNIVSEEQPTSAHYPAVIEGKNGILHVSYSYFVVQQNEQIKKTIRYAVFSEEWIKSI